jgi:NAD(P)-dependent dehydrogenase (short-subunit alcohol dehydrogenase family)
VGSNADHSGDVGRIRLFRAASAAQRLLRRRRARHWHLAGTRSEVEAEQFEAVRQGLDPNTREFPLTGASGVLGSRLCERLRTTHDIAGIRLRDPLKSPTQYQQLVDPLDRSQNLSENSDAVFEIRADLTIDAELERVIELALARFGTVDVLINAAACCISRPVIVDDSLMGSAEYQFRLNALVPLKLTKLLLDRVWRHNRLDNVRANRSVVNISSIAGVEVFRNGGYVGYGASKAALNFLTCSLAAELQMFGVRVNAIAPNSFPSVVKIDHVVDVIERFNSGTVSGSVVVLDNEKESQHEYAYRE